MKVIENPLYAISSVGLEDGVIDVVVMTMLLDKAREHLKKRFTQLVSVAEPPVFFHTDFTDK